MTCFKPRTCSKKKNRFMPLEYRSMNTRMKPKVTKTKVTKRTKISYTYSLNFTLHGILFAQFK